MSPKITRFKKICIHFKTSPVPLLFIAVADLRWKRSATTAGTSAGKRPYLKRVSGKVLFTRRHVVDVNKPVRGTHHCRRSSPSPVPWCLLSVTAQVTSGGMAACGSRGEVVRSVMTGADSGGYIPAAVAVCTARAPALDWCRPRLPARGRTDSAHCILTLSTTQY